jgi:hypothetical protein
MDRMTEPTQEPRPPRGTELTRENLLAAMEAVRNAPYTVCVGSDQHVVHPRERERGGLVRCAACLQVIDLGPGVDQLALEALRAENPNWDESEIPPGLAAPEEGSDA